MYYRFTKSSLNDEATELLIMSITKAIYDQLPYPVQNIAISAFNTLQYRTRHGGEYWKWREFYKNVDSSSKEQCDKIIEDRLNSFLANASKSSSWYREHEGKSLTDYPILEKSSILSNLSDIATIPEREAQVSLTGGTTGASMKVLYTKDDIQERHALLDHFRAQYGYKLGKRCAWFSGKSIVTEKDLQKGICYRDDLINKIRFFSTFHITDDNFDAYWKAFKKFSPEYIVGFPSSVYELCSMALARGLKLENTVKAFFPTAETLLPIHREVISSVLGCKIADQYASSEGAPFILECPKGGLHIHPITGVFEVVDEHMKPAQEGEILVTSFTTNGTPLIRYRIGDSIKLASENKVCACGSHFPLVEKIEGRSTDVILTPKNGRINSVNISNSTKEIEGIIQFQVIQNQMDSVEVLVKATNKFTEDFQQKFQHALSDRFGKEMNINMRIVDEIPKEKSGKFKVIKNLLI